MTQKPFERPVQTLTNPRADRVKRVRSLAGRSARRKEQRFLVEGPQSVREALRAHLGSGPTTPGWIAGRVIEQIIFDPDIAQSHPDIARMIAQCNRNEVYVGQASQEVLEAMADAVTPQSVIAVCRMPEVDLSKSIFEELTAQARLVAILCRVQDPGNAGTMIRTADAVGVDAVVLTIGSVDPFSPKTVRSTAGSLFHLPILVGIELAEAIGHYRQQGLQVLAADGYGDYSLDQNASLLKNPSVWLFGNEAQGLHPDELAQADSRVAVPIFGHAESLNVATAATVCLYASAFEQRR